MTSAPLAHRRTAPTKRPRPPRAPTSSRPRRAGQPRARQPDRPRGIRRRGRRLGRRATSRGTPSPSPARWPTPCCRTLVAEQLPGVDVLFLDTGYHFAETTRTRDEVAARARRDGSSTCCRSRPSPSRTPSSARSLLRPRPGACAARCARSSRCKDALGGYEVWFTGVRRDEAPDPHRTRRWSPGTSATGWSRSTRVAAWTFDELLDYAGRPPGARQPAALQRLPVDRLRAVHPARSRPARTPGPAAGPGFAKTECGLHL